MKKNKLIGLLNRDLADEHAAVIRYLVHGWMEGEGTPIGATLLSRSREEMWHMHWLGMIIGKLGGEPNLKPAPYPYDPTNRSTIFRSYVEYEESLIPRYNGEAAAVDDPHIKRVLERESWESAIHARKFRRVLDRLGPDEALSIPGGGRGMTEEFVNLLQKEVSVKYTEMLHHVRHSWVFQKNGLLAWSLMDQAMEKMKHIAHFAEEVAANGGTPQFKPGRIDTDGGLSRAVKKAMEDVGKSLKRRVRLRKDSEFNTHAGMVINLDLTIQQERYQREELTDAIKK